MPPKDTGTAGSLPLADMAREARTDILTDYHKRPGFGTTGKSIKVFANMYMASFNGPKGQARSVHHYDVDIEPVVKVANQKKPKALLDLVWSAVKAQEQGETKKGLEAAAFDSVKNLWTPSKLCDDKAKLEYVIPLQEDGGDPNDDKRRFRVVITYASTVDLDTLMDFCNGVPQSEKTKEEMLTAIQALNVLFRQDPSKHYKLVGAAGRKFFTENGATPICDGGIVYNGFIQSLRPTQEGRPAIQLDTAYSAFVHPGMGDDVAAVLIGMGGGGGGRGGRGGGRGGGGGGRGGRGGGPMGPSSIQGLGQGLQNLDHRAIRKLNEILRNAKFQVTYRKTSRVISIRSITSQPASEVRFLLEGKNGRPDRQITVPEYFKEVYNITLRKPRLPCVAYGARNYIPLELVKIMPFNSIPFRSLSSDQTADMIKVAAKRPQDRADMIRQWRRKLNYENLPQLRAWGIGVEPDMLEVAARVLTPPEVLYRNGGARPANGGWNLVGGKNKFITPGRPLRAWAAVSLDRYVSVQDLQNFVMSLVKNLRANGITVDNDRPPCIQVNPDGADGPYKNIKAGLRDAAIQIWHGTKMDPQLIIVVEARKDTLLKAEIKRIAAEGLKAPIVTQVLLSANLKKDPSKLDQYFNNVTMKINLKLGGANHTVPFAREGLDTKTMMIGADVTHPPPARGLIQPSIAVSVAATSGDNTIFKPAIRLQEGRVEMIKDLEEMVYNHLCVFEKNSKAKPEKILMYRDGVSEGQNELPKIKAACRRFGANYNPRVTFIICAKRHRMRFFAKDQRDADQRTGNLPPGLVVDRQVTHPYAFDFYLQAHAGLQGTAKPTHYVVMADEIGFTADKLQNLTNALCYTFARATRSVSIVPVAYYADIIAGAARDLVYTDDVSDTATVSSGTTGQGTTEFNPKRFTERFENHPTFGNVAWFM